VAIRHTMTIAHYKRCLDSTTVLPLFYRWPSAEH